MKLNKEIEKMRLAQQELVHKVEAFQDEVLCITNEVGEVQQVVKTAMEEGEQCIATTMTIKVSIGLIVHVIDMHSKVDSVCDALKTLKEIAKEKIPSLQGDELVMDEPQVSVGGLLGLILG